MLMPVNAPRGLGDLGKFNLRKAIKKLNPVTVTRKAVQLSTHPRALVATLKANNPVVVAKASIALAKEYNPAAVAKNSIALGRAVAKQQVSISKTLLDPRSQLKMAKAVLHSPAVQNIIKAAVVVVAGYFTGGSAVAPLMKLWMADRAKREAASAGGALTAQQQAEAARADADMRAQMAANGYSPAQADQVIAQLGSGADPAAALQSIGPPNPVIASAAVAAAGGGGGGSAAPADAPMSAPADASAVPVTLASEDVMQSKQSAARDKFIRWFAQWKPAQADALRNAHPELFEPLKVDTAALAGFDDDLGDWSGNYLGDWSDTLSSWADAVSSAVPEVLNTAMEAKTLQVQLARVKAGQSPLPTTTAQRLATTGGKPGLALSMPVVIGGVLALGLAAVLIAPRMFGRRHHSRFM